MKTYGNMLKRIAENIQKCAQKTYQKHKETYKNMHRKCIENI